MPADGKDKAVCESSNNPRYGQTLVSLSLGLSGETSLLDIITTHGEEEIGVSVGTSAGVSEGTGSRVSVEILVKVGAAGGGLAGVLVGKIIMGEVGKAGCGSQGGT